MSSYLEITEGLTKVARSATEQYRTYRKFSETIWSEGVLPSKEKELIAVGVAHSTKCNYCITHHTKKAKKEGASIDEVIESAMVAVPLEGISLSLEDALFRITGHSYSQDGVENPFLNHYENQIAITDVVFKPKYLSARLKYLIAIAICFTNKSTHMLDDFINKAINEGAGQTEIIETYYISALMKAGGTMSYITESIKSFQST
jgi:AhpD family alkylhydroperoxidase